MIAANTRGTASAEPFSVWAISVPLACALPSTGLRRKRMLARRAW